MRFDAAGAGWNAPARRSQAVRNIRHEIATPDRAMRGAGVCGVMIA
jgi:hypothetical protein